LSRVAGERAKEAVRYQQTYDELIDQRALLLGGREVTAVEAILRSAHDEGLARSQQASAALADARDRRIEATSCCVAALGHARTARADLETADAALTVALAAAGLDETAAAPLLARTTAWIESARIELNRVTAAHTHAAAVAAERRRQVEDHNLGRAAVAAALAAAGVPDPDLLDQPTEAWRAVVTTADAAVAHAVAALATLDATRRADGDARARRDSLITKQSALESQARPFELLAEVIGSADGKELRNFAQSLSLNALLEAANHHLDELAPRYQLARVAGQDLEIEVIDREMGDDIRAVSSLSGGESFLVSLALALGLSSLTATDVEVKTLFIDEGFGSLDPATLDSALTVLDALRASGRQVGIVSHMRELEERVAAAVAVRAIGGGKSVVTISTARA
jgi:exonuclease SbcC